MFRIKSGKWNWYFAGNQAHFTPSGDLSDLLEGAEIVKDNGDSLIFRRDGLFFKREKYHSGGWFETGGDL